MLCISRNVGETFFVGDTEIKIVQVRGDQVRLGIDAPQNVEIRRSELPKGLRIRKTNTIPGHHFNGDEPLEH